MNNEKILEFWLSLGNLILTIFCLFSLLFFGINKELIIIKPEYLIFLLPVMILSGFQFVINYCSLTNNNKKDDRY